MKKMKSKITSRIPEFKTLEEEAKFWETHSFSEFTDELKPVKVKFAKNLSEGITIRFDEVTLNKIRGLAHKKGIGPTTLARMWILEHLQQA
jgi:predicted DNA binding CopG/RHH family protein